MTEDVTGLLLRWSDGQEGARERLMRLVYGELKKIAARHLRGERVAHADAPSRADYTATCAR